MSVASACLLEGELTIYRAADLKDVCLAAIDADEPALDLSGITEIDTAGVQLLLLARREASARGRTLLLKAPSPAVCNAFELLELAQHLA